MTLVPYADAPDDVVVQGCANGDSEAEEALRIRHGIAVRAVVLRALAETDADVAAGVDRYVSDFWKSLGRSRAAPLRLWGGRSRLRTFLCQLARQETATAVKRRRQTETTAHGIEPPTRQTAMDQTLDPELSERLARLWTALERLPPHVGAMVRLRMRGLRRSEIAAALGLPTASVQKTLEQAASRVRAALLGPGGSAPAGPDVIALLMDVANPGDRVRAALIAARDVAYAEYRKNAQRIWSTASQSVLALEPPSSPLCLDDVNVAAFVDGTLRGAERARAEGHVSTCRRCVDQVSSLRNDLAVLDRTPAPARHDEDAARIFLAVVCIQSGHHELARHLLQGSAQRGALASSARTLSRLASLCLMTPRPLDARDVSTTKPPSAPPVPIDDDVRQAFSRAAALAPEDDGLLRQTSEINLDAVMAESLPVARSGALVPAPTSRTPDHDTLLDAASYMLQGDFPAASIRLASADGPARDRLQVLLAAMSGDRDSAAFLAACGRERDPHDEALLADEDAIGAVSDDERLPDEVFRERLLDVLASIARSVAFFASR
ncbi:MAG: hypothetical protein IT379_35815 [Deltaproteobacteria bacterium]|nr:hypothetical protein [Deltaproteobacteria bacterium]